MIKRFFFLLSLIFLPNIVACYAQFPPPPPPPPKPAPAKTVGKAEVTYFKEENRSRVNVNFTLLGSVKNILQEDVFQITTSFSVTGNKITRPDTVNLMIFSYTHGTAYRYKDNHDAAILIENNMIAAGTAHPTFSDIDPRGGVTEYYSITIPFEVVSKIIISKQAEIKFGNSKFAFNEEAITALKDLQATIES